MSVAFYIVFGFFAASMLVIAVQAVRWGRRRDRAARTGMSGPRGPGEGGDP